MTIFVNIKLCIESFAFEIVKIAISKVKLALEGTIRHSPLAF